MKTNPNMMTTLAALIKRARTATAPETAAEINAREQEKITTQRIRAELLLGASRTI